MTQGFVAKPTCLTTKICSLAGQPTSNVYEFHAAKVAVHRHRGIHVAYAALSDMLL
jgi:hypothetical protein